jgi:tetratricopeptide (TPR) repeat protein
MKRKGDAKPNADQAADDAAAATDGSGGTAGKKKGAMPQSNAKPHILQSLRDVTVTLEPADMPAVAVLLLRDCVRCTVRLAPSATVVKVSADSCEALVLELAGKVTTETLEAYKCPELSVTALSDLRTVQLDNCGEVTLAFGKLDFFERVVQSGVQGVRATFADTPGLLLHTTAASLAAAALVASAPEFCSGLPAASEQFISRLATAAVAAVAARADGTGAVAPAPATLVTEHIRRLANEYPSTLREAREHADRTRVRVGALGGGAGGAAASLLEGAAGAVSDEEKARLVELAAAAEAEAAAAEAAAHAAADAATELATRVEAKKAAGNRAHAEGDYHEAAVRYTEALALADSVPAAARPLGSAMGATEVSVRANRAAAFLKLGRYDQALADCDVALGAQPDHSKAAFRRGLALQALERYEESIISFARAHALEPNNGHITAALRMAEMQVRRQRAQG